MSWTEIQPMQRLDFIRACHAGTDSFSALCRLFGISRKAGYKWLQRFNPSDLSSLSDRSRAPRSHSRTVPDEVVGHLTALRQKHPGLGPKKLRMWLLSHHVDFTVLLPALSAISSSVKAWYLTERESAERRAIASP